MRQRAADLYVLGLLYIDGDMVSGPVLDRQQIDHIGWMFASTILNDTRVEAARDETYFKFKLSPRDNHLAFERLAQAGLSPMVDEVQFGYYHHRAIFKFSMRPGMALSDLRDARRSACQVVREQCFDRITATAIPNASGESQYLIRYVYSYNLLVVPDGNRELDREQRSLRNRFDPVFGVRSTTFGLDLPQRRSIVAPKRHYVRISVPSTVVYVDGRHLDPDLFHSLLDAIYYGGLYRKAQLDHESADGEFVARDGWTNDLLLRVFNILVESVRANERGDMALQISRMSLGIAIVALLFTAIKLVAG